MTSSSSSVFKPARRVNKSLHSKRFFPISPFQKESKLKNSLGKSNWDQVQQKNFDTQRLRLEHDAKSLESYVKIGFNLPPVSIAIDASIEIAKPVHENKNTVREFSSSGAKLRSSGSSRKNSVIVDFIKTYFQGMGSPLFALRSASFVKNGVQLGGRAYSLGCSLLSARDFCTLLLYANLRKEAYAEHPWVIRAFLREIRKFSSRPLSRRVIDETKSTMRAKILRHKLSMMGQAEFETLLAHTAYGSWDLQQKQKPKNTDKNIDYFKEYTLAIEKLEAAEIQEYAAVWLDEGRAAVHVLQGKPV